MPLIIKYGYAETADGKHKGRRHKQNQYKQLKRTITDINQNVDMCLCFILSHRRIHHNTFVNKLSASVRASASIHIHDQ